VPIDHPVPARVRGRPKGSTSFDAVAAAAFGSAIREIRIAKGLSQEALAATAGVERSHVGKIERGQHMPSLAAILKISAALECSAADLMVATETLLPADYNPLVGP
jgi:transcriptional regulator with XRE-family HTH domain